MAIVKKIEYEDFTWYNIETVDSDSIKFLKENFKFHSLDYKDLASGSEYSKVDVYKNYLFVVLHLPDLNLEHKRVVDKELDIFIGPNFLITVQKVRFKNIKDLYFKLLNNKNLRKDYFKKGPGYLLYKLLEKLFQSVFSSRLKGAGTNLLLISITAFPSKVLPSCSLTENFTSKVPSISICLGSSFPVRMEYVASPPSLKNSSDE